MAKKYLLVAAIVAIGVVIGLFFARPQQEPTHPIPREAPEIAEPEEITVTLYFSDEQAENLVPEARVMRKGKESLPELIIKGLIAGPKQAGHYKTIPETARLLSVRVEDEVAYVNFSQEFQTDHWGGSAGDIQTIYSVVNSLTELENIEAVQFLLEGEVEEAILGHVDTSQPIKRDASLLKK